MIALQRPWQDPSTGKLKHHSLALKPNNLRDYPTSSDGRLRAIEFPCDGCNVVFPRHSLFKCAGCKYARYCSKECQTQHWKATDGHKAGCKALQAAREGAAQLSPADRELNRRLKAMKLFSQGRFAEAECEFRHLIEQDCFFPNSIVTYTNLGTCVLYQGRVATEHRRCRVGAAGRE